LYKATVLVVTLATVSGCAAKSSTRADRGIAPPPQLWSDHKTLKEPVETCSTKAYRALTSLGLTGVVQNGAYSYGNQNGNRVAVKCVGIEGGSFVYFAVAGADKESVEKLRNEVAWKL
jgi:hypothetical protein